LLQKLMTEFEIEPYMVKLLASYFTNRRFNILNNGVKSKKFTIKNGVPPGSVLAALLFSLFINDIDSSLTLEYILYADDIVIYTDCLDYNEGVRKLNECVEGLVNWCNRNKLTISVDKTKVMYFCKPNGHVSRAAQSNVSEKVVIYGKEVEVVESFKYLGLIFDPTLSFKKHYNHVSNKLNGALGKMRSFKRIIPKSRLKIFLSAFCLSIIEYGINV